MRTLRQVFLSFLFISSVSTFAQKEDDPILLTVADREVKVSEFEAVYKKNNEKTDRKSLEEYLDLYINFRLKVKDAQDRGMDTLEQFDIELAGYRKQLAAPYLSDNDVTDGLVKEAYDRLQYEVRASHIMVAVTQNAAPSDTLKAYKKAESIRERVLNGEDFGKVAKEISEDPSAATNEGDLGYFSAMYMVYPFETEAYNTEVGKISNIVRTQFGYHIIKVTDKRKNRGSMTAAHIMVRTPENANPAQIEEARIKINEIYKKLKEGDPFEEMARLFSDDKASAQKGGALPPFTSGRMVAEFEEAAFALENDGDISKPVQTIYGFHIIKRLGRKEVGSYEENYGKLKQRISRDKRSTLSKKSFLKKVKEEYGFKEYPKSKTAFYTALDSSFFEKGWKASSLSPKLNKALFKIGDSTATQQDFAVYLEARQPKRKLKDLSVFVDKTYNKYVEEYLTSYEDQRLEEKYADFRLLMQEYHDGILLFDLTDQLVWSKAVKDTAGLEAYYEEHKNENMWGDRLHAVVYSCSSEDVAKTTKKHVKSREKKEYNDEDILKMVNEDSQLNLEIERGKFSKEDLDVLSKIEWKVGMSDDVKDGDRIVFVEVLEVLSPEPKSLTEVRGIMTSAYQNQLEDEWVSQLKDKYEVKVNKEYLDLIN